MRVVIAAIGKLKDGPERDLYTRYVDRIGTAGRAVGLGPIELIELPESRSPGASARMADEAGRLLGRSKDAGFRIVLDERGRAMTSQAFADTLRASRDRPLSKLAILIGGADGHDPAARQSADLMLSLSPMTLPHGLARIVLAEQIYRAVTILAGHPYHRA